MVTNNRKGLVKVRSANNFSEGIDTSNSPFFVKDSALIDGYGWDFNEYPALSVRKGRTSYGTAGTGTTRLLTNFGNTHLVRAVGTSLSYNSSGTTWTSIAGTFADIDWDGSNFDIGGPALILTNGTDTPRYWNGSALATITQMPKGLYVASDNLRVYTTGVTGDMDTISYCAFENALDWTTAENSGAVQFYTANGGPCTAIHAFNGSIWVFKKDALGIIYHTGNSKATHRLVTISDYIGCVSYKTVKQVGPYLFWLGQNQVYIGAGDGAVEIGQQVKAYLDNINLSAISNACAFADDQSYYLCIPTGTNTQPDTCLVYNYIYKKWLPYSINLGGFRFGASLNGNSYAGDNVGQIYKVNDGTTDNGTAISWEVDSRPFDDGSKESEKALYEMYLQGKFPTGTTLSVEVSPDDIGSTWYAVTPFPGNNSLAVTNSMMIVPLDTVPLCNFYRYRISGSGPANIQEVQRYSRIMPLMH